MKRELNIRHVWLRDGEKIDRDGNRFGGVSRSRFILDGGPAAAYQTWSQMIYKFLTAEQEYESTRVKRR
jgi:phage terminase large subunit GpA-like protein